MKQAAAGRGRRDGGRRGHARSSSRRCSRAPGSWPRTSTPPARRCSRDPASTSRRPSHGAPSSGSARACCRSRARSIRRSWRLPSSSWRRCWRQATIAPPRVPVYSNTTGQAHAGDPRAIVDVARRAPDPPGRVREGDRLDVRGRRAGVPRGRSPFGAHRAGRADPRAAASTSRCRSNAPAARAWCRCSTAWPRWRPRACGSTRCPCSGGARPRRADRAGADRRRRPSIRGVAARRWPRLARRRAAAAAGADPCNPPTGARTHDNEHERGLGAGGARPAAGELASAHPSHSPPSPPPAAPDVSRRRGPRRRSRRRRDDRPPAGDAAVPGDPAGRDARLPRRPGAAVGAAAAGRTCSAAAAAAGAGGARAGAARRRLARPRWSRRARGAARRRTGGRPGGSRRPGARRRLRGRDQRVAAGRRGGAEPRGDRGAAAGARERAHRLPGRDARARRGPGGRPRHRLDQARRDRRHLHPEPLRRQIAVRSTWRS